MGWAGDAFNKSMMRAGVGRPGNGSSCISSSGTLHNGHLYKNTPEPLKISKDNKEATNNITEKKVYKKHYDFPTEKQQRALNFITNAIGVKFEGKTKKEAIVFIEKYLGSANAVASRNE